VLTFGRAQDGREVLDRAASRDERHQSVQEHGRQSSRGSDRSGEDARVSRRAVWGVGVAVAALLVLLGVARLAEPALPPPDRLLSDARPGKHPALEARAAQARGALVLPPDPVTGWRAPRDGGLSRNNALGLRGAEVPPRSGGELRLLTLGDSSVWGWGVGEEQVFSAVAARRLGERLDRPVRGINGGIPGHETAQTLATLLDLGERLDPDVVVIRNL